MEGLSPPIPNPFVRDLSWLIDRSIFYFITLGIAKHLFEEADTE